MTLTIAKICTYLFLVFCNFIVFVNVVNSDLSGTSKVLYILITVFFYSAAFYMLWTGY